MQSFVPQDAFPLMIQRELCHSKCTRKVSELSRNGPLVSISEEQNQKHSRERLRGLSNTVNQILQEKIEVLFDRFGEQRMFRTICQVEFSICHLHLISDNQKYFTIFWNLGVEACPFDSFVLFGEERIFGTIRQIKFSICICISLATLRNISQYSGTQVEAFLFDQFVLFGEQIIFGTIRQIKFSICICISLVTLRNISRYSGTRVEACLFDRFVLFGEQRIFWTIRQVVFSIHQLHLTSETKQFRIFHDHLEKLMHYSQFTYVLFC